MLFLQADIAKVSTHQKIAPTCHIFKLGRADQRNHRTTPKHQDKPHLSMIYVAATASLPMCFYAPICIHISACCPSATVQVLSTIRQQAHRGETQQTPELWAHDGRRRWRPHTARPIVSRTTRAPRRDVREEPGHVGDAEPRCSRRHDERGCHPPPLVRPVLSDNAAGHSADTVRGWSDEQRAADGGVELRDVKARILANDDRLQ